MPEKEPGGELLRAASIPESLQPDPAWAAHNMALTAAGTDPGGAFAEFRRHNPDKAGNLSQCYDRAEPLPGGEYWVAADLRAHGEGAAGTNIYLYANTDDDHAQKVFQLSHPGDGAWHTLCRTFPVPDGTIRRIRVMLVLRSGEGPLGVRSVSLRALPAVVDRPPDLEALHVSAEFHAAVMEMIEQHPSAGDAAFRDRLYQSLIGGNRKGMRVVGQIASLLAPAGFSLDGGRFLDLGCGTGGSLVGAKTHGAAWCEGWEINGGKLDLARLNLGTLDGMDSAIALQKRSMEDTATLDPDAEPFDLVFCQEVLEHVKDIDAAVATLARCIAPARGAAHVTIPNGFALDSVLADPHLKIFGITLLDRFEAQPVATALKAHTHYSDMMGGYHRYDGYARLFAENGLDCRLLHPPDTSRKALRYCAARLEDIRRQRDTLPKEWAGRVDEETMALLKDRLDTYLNEVHVRLEHVRSDRATETDRLRFAQEFGTSHLVFLVAHTGSPNLSVL